MTITTVLKILGFLFDLWGASNETKRKYLELIESTKNDGLISKKARDRFKSQRQEIVEEMKADFDKAEKKRPPKETAP